MEKLSLWTWDVRTLYVAGAMTIVLSAVDIYRLDTVAFQKVRWTGSGNTRSNNHTIFYSWGTNHESGVGFIVNNNMLPYVIMFEPYNDGLCYLQIECKRIKIALVKGYVSTEERGDQIKQVFYSEVDRI